VDSVTGEDGHNLILWGCSWDVGSSSREGVKDAIFGMSKA
jgi:hypothetical protein